MARFNYQAICNNNLLKDLASRTREVMVRRFGLAGKDKGETLESIGQSHHITRERVRQIEEDGFRKLADKLQNPICQNVFKYFADYLGKNSGLKREDVLLSELAGEQYKNHVYFLLVLAKTFGNQTAFERFNESDDYYAFWAVDKNAINLAKNVLNSFILDLRKSNKSMSLPADLPLSFAEISKNIVKSPEGLYGLPEWPEVNPRGIKDKAYIVFKKEQNPLHFAQVAALINNSGLFGSHKKVIVQTVHNELIKDPRFVLVGRGLYALREWGYEPGVVREVIGRVIKGSRRPMTREEILEKVLGQRMVKANTVFLNLQDKSLFFKDSQGRYTIREV